MRRRYLIAAVAGVIVTGVSACGGSSTTESSEVSGISAPVDGASTEAVQPPRLGNAAGWQVPGAFGSFAFVTDEQLSAAFEKHGNFNSICPEMGDAAQQADMSTSPYEAASAKSARNMDSVISEQALDMTYEARWAVYALDWAGFVDDGDNPGCLVVRHDSFGGPDGAQFPVEHFSASDEGPSPCQRTMADFETTDIPERIGCAVVSENSMTVALTDLNAETYLGAQDDIRDALLTLAAIP